MATNTYVALDKKTTVGSVTSVEFTSIPSTYTDLVLVINSSSSGAGSDWVCQFNGDTGTNYSYTQMSGTGSTTSSTKPSNQTQIKLNYYGYNTTTAGEAMCIAHFQNYSNTTTFKTTLSRSSAASNGTAAVVGLWRSTAAISSIKILTGDASTYSAGSTFSLYGIKAEVGGSTPKATGGTVTSDSTYYYHTFTTTGNFVPNQTLSCDILQIAGGGGAQSGGGGAGGLLYFSSQSLTAGNYSAIVGGGGAGNSGAGTGTNGSNSQFHSLTASVGGGRSGYGGSGFSGGSGGGAGSSGAGTSFSGGSGTSGQGNAGGNNFAGGYPNEAGGGGGGAGAAGANGTSGAGGAGGAGVNTYSSWASVTGTGVAGYYAGGGGSWGRNSQGAGGSGGGGAGTSGNNPSPSLVNGVTNTGSGGGATDGNPSGNGGSGIIIVRYAK